MVKKIKVSNETLFRYMDACNTGIEYVKVNGLNAKSWRKANPFHVAWLLCRLGVPKSKQKAAAKAVVAACKDPVRAEWLTQDLSYGYYLKVIEDTDDQATVAKVIWSYIKAKLERMRAKCAKAIAKGEVREDGSRWPYY